MEMKCVLDTNFIIYLVEKKVDIFSCLCEYGKPKFYITRAVLDEIKKITKNKGSKGKNARAALKLIEELGIKVLKYNSDADKSLIVAAKELGMFLCTHDRKLIDISKKTGIKIVMLRGKGIIIK
ncbi:MAG TPA: hypothetical protein ENG42_00530 [Candidatus Aenigmarchaeota archaeon]|nr:MAG: hypothetical protein DRP03_02830 [Candidatus Aenigmarchaeota archaeon]HDD45937.1 hypothetical protein [Candidatus Aenigmarchaeota archaeon]